jgi:arginase
MSSFKLSNTSKRLFYLAQHLRPITPAYHRAFRSSPAACKSLSHIGVAVHQGQKLSGPDRSPQLLKEHGLMKLVEDSGWALRNDVDFTEILHPSLESTTSINARNHHSIGINLEQVSSIVSQSSKDDDFTLIIGGDHSISIGTIPALLSQRPDTGVIWVDAHADINTPKTSPSGNIHGMSVAFLLGLVDTSSMPSFAWFKPCLKPQDLVYIGLRDLDVGEKEVIRKLGIKVFTMYEIDRFGIGEVMRQSMEHLKTPNIHLSYDIDALDPFFAPHTGTSVRGGLTFREGNYICEALAETQRLRSMELVEINPNLHSNLSTKLTVGTALTLVGSALGQRIL